MSLLTSLISYWKLDESSGDALDAHGTNTLTEQSTVSSAAGKVSSARDFDGGADYFEHASNSDLQSGDIDFSFACWVKADAVGSYPVIANKGWSPTGGEWVLYVRSDDSNKLWFSVAADSNTVKSSPISTGTWYHVVVWHDALNNEIGISVNGTATTASYSGGTTAGAGDFRLGASPGQGIYWDGLIDESAWWKRVLTSQERADLYNGGAGLAYPLSTAAPAGLLLITGDF